MDPETRECLETLKELHDRLKQARDSFLKFLEWLGLHEEDSARFDPEKLKIVQLQKEIYFRNQLDELEGPQSAKRQLLELYRLQLHLEDTLKLLLNDIERNYIHANLFYQYLLDPQPIQESSLALEKCKELFPEQVSSRLFPIKRELHIVKQNPKDRE